MHTPPYLAILRLGIYVKETLASVQEETWYKNV